MNEKEVDAAKLDLKKYRTGELTEQLTELISIPGALYKIVVTTFVMFLVVSAVIALMIYFIEASGFVWFFVCVYSLLFALVAGFALGLLRVVYRSLGNIESILKLTLGIAQNAAADSEQLQSGKVRPPTGSELISQVYEDVVAPTLEKAVVSVFGWFGGPVYWIYNRTISSGIRLVLRRVSMPQLSEEQDAAISKGFEAGVTESSGYALQIQRFTDNAAGIVGTIGGGIRSYVMRPIFVGYCILLSVAAIPILVFGLWYGWRGTPAEEKVIDDAQKVIDSVSGFFYLF